MKERGRVESEAPNHLGSALGQMANFLGILQSEWAGAQAFSSFDTYLAPYVFKDKLEYKDIKRGIRSFIYNLNVPASWGKVFLQI
jgi:ribonucleoside-triphosphate reductase